MSDRPRSSAALRRMAGWAAAAPIADPIAARPPSRGSGASCELCPVGLGEQHRHLLHLGERRIICVCETCWSTRSGDPELRPTGGRTLWLEELALSQEAWAAFQIPIGLAFLMRSTVTRSVVALYPSPAGATESELELDAWDALCAANPILERLEPDVEALIVDRTGAEPRYAIAPIDTCYALVGLVKSRWQGITGGGAVDEAIDRFFDGLRAQEPVR